MSVSWGAGLFALVCVGISSARAADVNVNINLGTPPPPPVVVEAPPRLVIVRDVPAVRYAPDLSVNFFVYAGRYFTFHDRAWFVTGAYGEPWVYMPTAQVPRAVRVIPARYYRIPPGHAKKRYREHPGKHGHDDEGHGGHHGHGHGNDHDD
jgi:hypothetical protein